MEPVTVVYKHQQGCHEKAVQFFSLMPNKPAPPVLMRVMYCEKCCQYTMHQEPVRFEEQRPMDSAKVN